MAVSRCIVYHKEKKEQRTNCGALRTFRPSIHSLSHFPRAFPLSSPTLPYLQVCNQEQRKEGEDKQRMKWIRERERERGARARTNGPVWVETNGSFWGHNPNCFFAPIYLMLWAHHLSLSLSTCLGASVKPLFDDCWCKFLQRYSVASVSVRRGTWSMLRYVETTKGKSMWCTFICIFTIMFVSDFPVPSVRNIKLQCFYNIHKI